MTPVAGPFGVGVTVTFGNTSSANGNGGLDYSVFDGGYPTLGEIVAEEHLVSAVQQTGGLIGVARAQKAAEQELKQLRKAGRKNVVKAFDMVIKAINVGEINIGLQNVNIEGGLAALRPKLKVVNDLRNNKGKSVYGLTDAPMFPDYLDNGVQVLKATRNIKINLGVALLNGKPFKGWTGFELLLFTVVHELRHWAEKNRSINLFNGVAAGEKDANACAQLVVTYLTSTNPNKKPVACKQ